MHNVFIQFLIKFILLLCASLSVHSALALPLSSLLATNYYATTDSVVLVEQINANTKLNDFISPQYNQSKLQKSLLTLLQQEHNYRLVMRLYLRLVNELDIDIVQKNAQITAQAMIQQTYQTQLSIHIGIQARHNALYTQKPSYQAREQHQQNFS
ncbi:hypothetical protein [Colwellia psychrerythraea]|uniref:Uncharacterized protein n=1 Tax=Colwellia psychrerythraea TaxID=28229 RepID=A0A099KZ80_COLPS|nr:hypothetical protein [Colwellia psychrerythraea]KGJ94958.1 hypothetical protein GAB14E_2192 [Colwellia psychrerythraea]